MSLAFQNVRAEFRAKPRSWLVTGAAGFIGSALVEELLTLDQQVTGLDNFSTGHRRNLDDIRLHVSDAQWANFQFVEGDIRSFDVCTSACNGIEFVLHQAALGSVPRSIDDPLLTHDCNLTGFLNILTAARNAGVRKFVYAASSSTYGDSPSLPKREDVIGRPLSPYAVTKYANELYADVYARCYGLAVVGLRYFNVFGPRQDPNGPYAAVIPRWFDALLNEDRVYINGDGETSRDFCYIENVVQANFLAATTSSANPGAHVYNVAVGQRTTLNQLFQLIREQVSNTNPRASAAEPSYREHRAGDIRHSLADVSQARRDLGYVPTVDVKAGIAKTADWYTHRPRFHHP